MTTLINNDPKIAGRWTKEEHQKFLYGLKLYGKNWKKIQDLIETRTSTQIRSHAQKFFIKMKKLQCDDEDSEFGESESQNKVNQQTLIAEHDEKFLENQTSAFSFYFDQIAKNYLISERKGQQFNFWTCLVEVPDIKKHKSCELISLQGLHDIELRKCNSFEDYNRAEIAKSSQLIRTAHSPFQQYKQE